MAKQKSKHKSTALARPITFATPRPVAPVVLKQTKVVHVKPKKHKHKGHRSGGFGLGGLLSGPRIGIIAGAAAFGFLEKSTTFASIPSLPLIGKAGTIGLAAYLLGSTMKSKLLDEVSTAAFVIAAHEFASTGTVSGGEVDPSEVGYVAGW